MNRLIQAAAVALTLAAPTLVPGLAHAAPDFDASDLQVRVRFEEVRTPSGQAAALRQIAAAANAYCRAHPVGATIADCRQDITERLTQNLEREIQLALRSHPATLVAAR